MKQYIDITSNAKGEVQRIKNLVGGDTYRALQESKAILAGGAITSIFTNREVNDLDTYFKTKEGFQNFIEEVYFLKGYEGVVDHFNILVANTTNRSILCQDKETESQIQLIGYKTFPTVTSIFNSFDFTINMAAYDFETERLLIHPDFMRHCSQRYISFNKGTDYPLASAMRVQKYVERGYTISKSEMFRILFACAKKGYSSWEVVKDEMGTMYGIPLDDLFNTDKEFSIDEVIDQLKDNPKTNFKSLWLTENNLTDVVKKFPHFLDEEWRENTSSLSSTNKYMLAAIGKVTPNSLEKDEFNFFRV